MNNKGIALMGVGTASGEHKTVEAAQRAISSPLLDDVSIAGATSVLLNVTGNSELTMYEVHEASSLIQEECHEDVNLIWGWGIDETMEDEVQVTVIATGFDEDVQMGNRTSPESRMDKKIAVNGGQAWRGGPQGPKKGIVPGFDLSHEDYDIPTFFKNAD